MEDKIKIARIKIARLQTARLQQAHEDAHHQLLSAKEGCKLHHRMSLVSVEADELMELVSLGTVKAQWFL